MYNDIRMWTKQLLGFKVEHIPNIVKSLNQLNYEIKWNHVKFSNF